MVGETRGETILNFLMGGGGASMMWCGEVWGGVRGGVVWGGVRGWMDE